MSLASIVQTGRRLLATTMLDTALIADRSTTSDGKGGVTEAWTARTVTEPCRYVQQQDSPPTQISGVLVGPATCTILLSLDSTLAEGDKVTSQSGQVWFAVADLTPDSDTATVRRLTLREIP